LDCPTSLEGVVQILNILLGREYDFVNTRDCHWNVKGQRFHQPHEFLEDQYKELSDIIDGLAERARHLGGQSRRTVAEITQNEKQDKNPEKYPAAQSLLSNLLTEEAIIQDIQKNIDATGEHHDIETNSFLCKNAQRHEKMDWMLLFQIQGRELK
jgi:starvation-inducible DNA-binding protein